MSENSSTATDSTKSSSTPSSAPSSPAGSTTTSSSTAKASPSKSTKSDTKSADSHKRDGSGGLSSFKASLEKVKSATSSTSSTTADATPSASSTSGSTNWTSVLTFGLASSKGKGDISEWLPDLTDKLPTTLFASPPPQLDGKPGQPALPADVATAAFPNFTSLLPPQPPPSSALRFGWIDEYGDYHPAAVNTTAATKLNVKLLKAREQAKELIANVMAAQEKLEKDKDPQSPRMSAIVKERLSIEGEKRDSRGQGVERLVQVVEGSKGEKKVVVTQDENVPEDL